MIDNWPILTRREARALLWTLITEVPRRPHWMDRYSYAYHWWQEDVD